MASLLSLATLPRAPQASQPVLGPHGLSVGIVHLGVGAFHRAHQAVYTEMASHLAGDDCWGICGVSERSAAAADALAAQDGLYSVLSLGDDDSSVGIVGSLRQTLFARRDSDALMARLASPDTKVVTLTVSEKGYRFSSGDRRLRADDPEIEADAGGMPPMTVLGQLARGLELRRRSDGGPLTVMSCDNISGNGPLLRQLLYEFLGHPSARFDAGLGAWAETYVRFPATMVDRIVPTTTERWRDEVARRIGLSDLCAVVTEPFSQWVIEDDFAGPRPAWERAGAEIVADVAPYEALKLRTLNGAHSALAYLGLLSGCGTVAEALRRPALERFVRKMLDEEVRATLTLPAGTDFARYRDTVLRRFANRQLPYQCSQVASDGSGKLPQRALGVVRDLLRAGTVPRLEVMVVAAWLRAIWTGTDDAGAPFALSDPLAERLRAAMGPGSEPGQAVDGALGVRQVFGDDLAEDERFRSALTESLSAISHAGAEAAARDIAGG